MSYHNVTHHVETTVPVIAGEWTITARVYLCDGKDRHDCHRVDEWLLAHRVGSRMDTEEFLAHAIDINRNKLTDAVIQQAIDEDEHPSIARGDYEYDRKRDERMEEGR